MANKRTVDPLAESASSKIVGIRMTDRQVAELLELSKDREMTRSELVRSLVSRAHASLLTPEPF